MLNTAQQVGITTQERGNHSAPVPNQLPSTSSGNDTQPELVEGVGGSERLRSVVMRNLFGSGLSGLG